MKITDLHNDRVGGKGHVSRKFANNPITSMSGGKLEGKIIEGTFFRLRLITILHIGTNIVSHWRNRCFSSFRNIETEFYSYRHFSFSRARERLWRLSRFTSQIKETKHVCFSSRFLVEYWTIFVVNKMGLRF